MLASQILVMSILSATAVASSGQVAVDPDPNRFAGEIKAFSEWDSKNAAPADPVLFVGSSSIRMWRTRESFPDLPVVNRGFGGCHVCDVIHYLDRVVLPYDPQVLVFYAGDNDIAGGKSAQRVADDYRRFVRLVHAKLPATRIVYITIKPSGQRWSLWPEMKKANDLIREFCQGDERLHFADLATVLLAADGPPKPEYYLSDRLHLNSEGYAAWTRVLRPFLSKAVTSRP
ncbi:MAG TPA: SGNH/GDSL hydrolase family protein [Sedimentisphaerales bacterium]|jgi:lysophospholipase L1-like esterase|nr:SGNH/GDSL hydrolase family protein [Sedimentisphaerales bacterium]HNU28646.1 SGNH/GDSL hydrolase family protein [Sedimentisphaerales bacterium]